MCLSHDPGRTRKLAARLEKKGYVIGYKVLRRYLGSLESIYKIWYGWKPGWNKASDKKRQFFITQANRFGMKNNKSVKYSNVRKYTPIYEGIHICTNKKAAQSILNDFSPYYTIIVPVKCYKNDFISSGYFNDRTDSPSAVFTKVFLTKKDYEKALGGEK